MAEALKTAAPAAPAIDVAQTEPRRPPPLVSDLGDQYAEERAEAGRRSNDVDAWADSVLEQQGQPGQTAADAAVEPAPTGEAEPAPPADLATKIASPLERWLGATLPTLVPLARLRQDINAVSGDVARDVARGVVEAPGAVTRGASAAVQNTFQTLDSLAEWLDTNVADLNIPTPEWVPEWINKPLAAVAEGAAAAKDVFGERASTTGKAVEFISQWLTSQALAGKITKAFGMPAGALKRIVDAGAGGGAGFDPRQDRLSNVISKIAPNPLTDWLKADKDDPELLARVKSGLEVAGLQAVSEGVILGLKTLKSAWRAGRPATPKPAPAAPADEAGAPDAPARDILRGAPPVTLSDDLVDKAAKFLAMADEPARASADEAIRPAAKAGESALDEIINAVRDPSKFDKGTDLLSWIVRRGGIQAKEGRGELEAIGLSSKSRPGLLRTGINPKTGHQFGMSLDEVARAAWEAGFVPERTTPPSLNEFLDILGEHVAGRAVRKVGLDPGVEAFRATVDDASKHFDLLGIDVSKMSNAQVRKALDAIALERETLRAGPGGGPARTLEEIEAVPVTLSDDFAGKAVRFVAGAIDDAPIQVNFARFEGPESVRKTIIDIAKQLPEAKTIPMETTLRAAREMGLTPAKLAEMEGTLFDRRQIMGGWMLFRSSAGELAKLAETARRTGAPADVSKFNAAFQITHSVLATVKGQSSELARALQIHNALRKSEPEMVKALQGLIDEAGGTEVALDMATRIAALADPAKAAEFIAQIGAKPTRDRIVYAWSNILLSNPVSHVANVGDTGLATLMQVPETWFASKIGTDVVAGEATARLYGITQGFKDGLRLAARALKTGESQFKIGTRVEGLTAQPLAASDDLVKSGVVRQAGDYFKMLLPTRLMMAGDELTKVMNYRGELHALAWREAVQQGLDPKAAALAAQRMVDSPVPSMIAAAEAQALKGTFNETLEGNARAMAQWIDKVNVAGIPVGRLIVPFVRTPINLVRWTTHRTPFAFLSPKIQAELAAGGATRDLALARIAGGSVIGAAFADLTMQGRITGAGPKDPGMRAALMRTGWQPYSFHVGGKFISYNRSGTIGMLIGISADATELVSGVYTRKKDTVNFDGEPVEDAAAAVVVFPFAGAILNKTWMNSLSNLIDALADPMRRGESYFRRFAGSFVPAGLGAVERTVDPEIRRAETALEAIRARIPGASSELEPRLNLWGERLVDENGIYNLFLPARISAEKGGAIDKEILRLKIEPAPPRQIQAFGQARVEADVKLSPAQHNRLIALAGNELKLSSVPGMAPVGAKDALEAIVTGKAGALSRQYEQASDDRRELMIRDVLVKYRRAAKAALVQEDGRLRDLVTQTLTKRAGDLGRPRESGIPLP